MWCGGYGSMFMSGSFFYSFFLVIIIAGLIGYLFKKHN